MVSSDANFPPLSPDTQVGILDSVKFGTWGMATAAPVDSVPTRLTDEFVRRLSVDVHATIPGAIAAPSSQREHASPTRWSTALEGCTSRTRTESGLWAQGRA